MVLTYDDSFNVTWHDPQSETEHWRSYPDRFPDPIPFLNQEILTEIWEVCFGQTNGARMTFANGYAFWRQLNRGTLPAPTPEMLERGTARVWLDEYQPLVLDEARKIRGADYETPSDTELAAGLDEAVAAGAAAMFYTTVVLVGMNAPTQALIRFCSTAFGEDGPRLAMLLLSGFDNDSAAAGMRLNSIAQFVSTRPGLQAAIDSSEPETIESQPDGQDFLRLFEEYLDEFGWRLETWGLLHKPTWKEQPRQAFQLISRLASSAKTAATFGPGQASQVRMQTQADLEARLSLEERVELNGLIEAARDHVAVSESRAHCQLTVLGSLRVPFLAAGRRLVTRGQMRASEDVWFLKQSELKQALSSRDHDLTVLVEERKADLEHWATLSPPSHIGAPPPERTPEMQEWVWLFQGLGPSSFKGQTLKGQAASAGVVTGAARIIRSLDDAERLADGDILVCQSTSPAWTPLFALAAGVVTDGGGVLSHSAICAREAGIPCVVATQVATTTIPDGAIITVDGSAGTVTIEGEFR